MAKKKKVNKAKHSKTKSSKKISKKIARDKGMIREALTDLSKEISNINKQKRKLNDQTKSGDKTLETYREFEKQLQQKIAKLTEREAFLRDKRKKISLKEEILTEKLSKVEKIKSELNEI